MREPSSSNRVHDAVLPVLSASREPSRSSRLRVAVVTPAVTFETSMAVTFETSMAVSVAPR
ncbi:MAG: hypothetical protein ABIR11_10755 [Candidatus Limnocylindrales bacterium]